MLAIPGETFPLASPEPQWAPNRGVDINSNPSPSLLLQAGCCCCSLKCFANEIQRLISGQTVYGVCLAVLQRTGGEQPPSELDVSPRAPAGPVYPRPVNRLSIYLETAVK